MSPVENRSMTRSKTLDDEFEREVLESLDQATTKISLRMRNELLGRTKQAAQRWGVPGPVTSRRPLSTKACGG